MADHCKHLHFSVSAEIANIEDIRQFHASVRITCSQCGLPFKFLGLEAGVSSTRPMVSVGGDELRLPIAPMDAPGDNLIVDAIKQAIKSKLH